MTDRQSRRRRISPCIQSGRSLFNRGILLGLIVVGCPWLLASPAAAGKVQINCNIGQTINGELAAHATDPTLVLVVKGVCTENVVITRDDVTIRSKPTLLVSIIAADSNQPALRLDGARRIVIDGVMANGLTFSGGTVGISASRGSTVEITNCVVTGTSQNGIISALGSSVSVDGCTVSGNTGNGVVAANTAALGITNSTVSNNGMSGIVGVRGSMLRVGQDLAGSLTVRPVTVSGNGSNGIAITESSAGNIVGGTVSQNTATGIFVGRGSSGQIGLGSNGLTGGVSITNGLSNGISVEGGNATIVFNTITGNQLRGIVVSNGGNARIGVTNNNAVFGANTISGNSGDGIGIFAGGCGRHRREHDRQQRRLRHQCWSGDGERHRRQRDHEQRLDGYLCRAGPSAYREYGIRGALIGKHDFRER